MKYRAEIDGLRALAVIPVIFFHAGFKMFSGGFIGVDIFFVISGYLITTILIEDIEKNQFSILYFYERRARRILPILFFVMLICIPFAWLWMLPSHMKDFSESLLAMSFFASNILFWKESGYFEAAADEKPLLHTWSLAVEEQYYLLFPVFLIFAWRFGRNKVFWMIILMAIISLLISEWGWRNKEIANFYLAPTRAWELFAGSISAFIIYKKGVKKNNPLALLGLSAIIFSIFAYDKSTPIPSVYALVPVLGVMLLVLYADQETLVGKILSSKVLVGVGLISYSAYLWHQPLFAFARIRFHDGPSEIMMIALSIMSIILAFFSWKYIEKPFRNLNSNFFTQKKIFSLAIIGVFIFSFIGLTGHFKNGFKNRFVEVVDGDVGHFLYHQYVDKKYLDCEPKKIAKSALSWDGFLRCQQSAKGEFDWLLLGDSHAEHLFLGLAEENPNINLAYYIFGAPPYLEQTQFKEIFEVIDKTKTSKTIFLTMHYVSRINNEKRFKEGFSNTINFLKKLGHRVILIGDIPRYDVSPERCKYKKSIQAATNHCSISFSDFKKQRDKYEPILKELSFRFKIPFFTIHEPLCNDIGCSMVLDKTILYRNSDHLNIPGSILIGKFLSNKIAEMY